MNELMSAATSLPKFTDYIWALARLPDSWLIVARNLVPAVGVWFFGWSVELTAFNYWFDGVSALGAMIGVLLAGTIPEGARQRDLPPIAWVMFWFAMMFFVFGACAIPYWLLLNSHLGVVHLDVVGKLFDGKPSLWLAFGALLASHVWNALRAGYAGLANDAVKRRFGAQFWTLLIRAVAMLIVSHLGSAVLFVPGMALVLMALETRPLLRERMPNSAKPLQR